MDLDNQAPEFSDKPRIRIPASALNACYAPYLSAPQRTQLFYGGAGSGKSVFIATRVALDALAGRNTLVARKVARTLRSSCFAEITKAIARLHLCDRFRVTQGDMRVTCVDNQCQILFMGLDDAEKIKSVTPACGPLTDVWLEEATEAAFADVRQLMKRLRGVSPHPKRLTLSFNPVSRGHWLYREYFADFPEDAGLLLREDLLILRTTYRDNRFLSQDDRDALEAETDAYFRDVYTLGKWGVQGGAVFANWRVGEPPEDLPAQEMRCGVDFGFSGDPCAAVLLRYDRKRRRVYALAELCEKGLTNDRLAKQLKDMAGTLPVTCDSAEPKSIAELRQRGVRAGAARKGPDSLRHGIQWLQQQEIIVSPACPQLREELLGYHFRKDNSGAALPRPEGPDHLIDAMRYALEGDALDSRAMARGR